MLDELTRDTLNLLALVLTTFSVFIIGMDKMGEQPVFILVVIMSVISIILFGIFAVRGSILLIKRGLLG